MPKPMTPEAIEQAAYADRDAQPLTEADLKRMKRTPQAKIIRRALELTQKEFAARYHIPVSTNPRPN
jgi:putative transcriptional regulator